MTDHHPNHRHRVAQPRLGFIAEGDAVPSTHTDHSAALDQNVTNERGPRPPLPFADEEPRRRIAGALGIALLSAVMAATPAWIVTNDWQMSFGIGALVVAIAFGIAAPALVGRPSAAGTRLSREECSLVDAGQSETSATVVTMPIDVQRLRDQLVELERRGFRR